MGLAQALDHPLEPFLEKWKGVFLPIAVFAIFAARPSGKKQALNNLYISVDCRFLSENRSMLPKSYESASRLPELTRAPRDLLMWISANNAKWMNSVTILG